MISFGSSTEGIGFRYVLCWLTVGLNANVHLGIGGVGDGVAAELDSRARKVLAKFTSVYLRAFCCLILESKALSAHSLFHDSVAEGVAEGVALALKLERGSGVGGTGQLNRPNCQNFSHQ